MATSEVSPDLLKHVINPWLLGADPEFAVVEPPDKTVPNSGANAVEAQLEAGGIGSDHHGRVWELRPKPSPSAYKVTTNIWELLKAKELNKVAAFKWKSGALGGRPYGQTVSWMATGYMDANGNVVPAPQAAPQPVGSTDTLGGHVHFGCQNLNGAQLKGLNKLTTLLLSLDVLPEKENTVRTRNSNYGRIGSSDAVRSCGDYGETHIEYRCAPSWLDNPMQSFACLTSYKLAAARPSSLEAFSLFKPKEDYLDWIAQLANVDVDAFLLDRFIEKRGFKAIQADPDSDFKPNWRKEDLWSQT